MSTATAPSSTTTQTRHVLGGTHPAWCRRGDCTGIEGDPRSGHTSPDDLAHDSSDDVDPLDVPLTLHSPFAYNQTGHQTEWRPTFVEVRARQPMACAPELMLHLFGSKMRHSIADDGADDGASSWQMDTELAITPREARQLAEMLLMVADAIDNDTAIGAPGTTA
jgi:hypothetical protein